jgi:chaperonin cofactor prefoldin
LNCKRENELQRRKERAEGQISNSEDQVEDLTPQTKRLEEEIFKK